MEELEKTARAFAEERHAQQKYGDAPYVIHLSAVREDLRSFGHGGEASRTRPDKLAMYQSELPAFEEGLGGQGDARMWKHLRAALQP